MRNIHLIIHNVRSAHNVGSLLRTADCFGIQHVVMSGITPFPKSKYEKRLPHIAKRAQSQIIKTSLGAENYVCWSHRDSIEELINDYKDKNFHIIGLEQSAKAINLSLFKPAQNQIIIVGNEVNGIEIPLQNRCDTILQIPQYG